MSLSSGDCPPPPRGQCLGCPSRLTQAQPLSDPVSWWGNERRAERGCSIPFTVWGWSSAVRSSSGLPGLHAWGPAASMGFPLGTQVPLLPVAGASPGVVFGGGPLPCLSLPAQTTLLTWKELGKPTLPILLTCAWTQLLRIKNPYCGRGIPGNTKRTGGGQQRWGLVRHTWTQK